MNNTQADKNFATKKCTKLDKNVYCVHPPIENTLLKAELRQIHDQSARMVTTTMLYPLQHHKTASSGQYRIIYLKDSHRLLHQDTVLQ